MMIPSSREEEIPTKEEADTNDGRISVKAASSSSTPWLRFKDPRIVRVSRAFGGKDRHSKVCTVRGLRDRRVRLSVPTAIQLYDLQDRLGLNQPSKVVDWLLEVAKDEIDELPPLQIPPGNFPSSSRELNPLKTKSKEVIDGDATKGNEGEGNQASLQGLVNNAMPFSTNNNYFHWEPSSISLSSLGHHGFMTTQNENLHNFNVVPMSLPSGSHHQVLVCPSGTTTQPYFPSHGGVTPLEFSSLAQPLYSLGQAVRPFPLSMTSMLLHSQNESENQQNKNSEFHLK